MDMTLLDVSKFIFTIFVSGCSGGIVTYWTFRSSRWKVSPNRQEWLNDLRKSISILESKLYSISQLYIEKEILSDRIQDNNFYNKMKILFELYEDIFQSIIYIQLLLSSDKINNIECCSNNCCKRSDRKESNKQMKELKDLLNTIKTEDIFVIINEIQQILSAERQNDIQQSHKVFFNNFHNGREKINEKINKIHKTSEKLISIEWRRIKKGI